MKKTILSFFALLLLGSTAKAEEGFTVEDNINLPQGGEVELQVAYNFEARDCKGLQFNIDLPTGLEFVESGGTITSAQGFDSKYELIAKKDAQGSLLVTWVSQDGTPIPRKIGVLVALKVKATGSHTVGTTFDCTLRDAIRTLPNGQDEHLSGKEFTVTIADPADYDVLLDENSLFEPEDTNDDVDILVKRTITAEEWSTICFPFDINKSTFKSIFGNDAILAEFDTFNAEEDGSISVNFDTTNKFEANTPYLIKTSKNITSFKITATIESDDIKAGGKNNGFFGTYKACTPVPVNNLVLSNNQFYYSTGLIMIKGFRGYFYFKSAIIPKTANSRTFFTINGSDATNIQNAKIAKNETGKVYSISGRYMGEKVNMKSLPKGVYVVDGVKVINK